MLVPDLWKPLKLGWRPVWVSPSYRRLIHRSPFRSIADPSFTLDLSSCVNLRRIILSITVGYGGGAIAALSRLLSTLREHKLSNIRLVADNPQVYDLPALVESWERLDQVLNKLGGQARGRGETLIFQIASIVAFTKQAIAALLPRFNETGVCEGVTL